MKEKPKAVTKVTYATKAISKAVIKVTRVTKANPTATLEKDEVGPGSVLFYEED
jgi:hypothetical protein